jgi:hypothetical protein
MLLLQDIIGKQVRKDANYFLHLQLHIEDWRIGGNFKSHIVLIGRLSGMANAVDEKGQFRAKFR